MSCSYSPTLTNGAVTLPAADSASKNGSAVAAIAGVIALIPAHNEARFIGSVVLSTLPYVETVIVVDDGSQDETATIARKAGATVLELPHNMGKSAAMQHGLRIALQQPESRLIIMLDGDGQHDPTQIPALIQPVLNGRADLVVGSRFKEIRSQIPWWRQIGQHGLTWATNAASGVTLSDSQSGFRALSVEAARALRFRSSGFSIESEMQFAAREHKLRIAEVPITCVYEEPPKRNPVAHGLQVLDGILKMVLQMRPLLFFGAFSLVTLLAGLYLGMRVISTFQRTAQLAVGTGLITVMLIIIGSICLSTGVTLHSIRALLTDQQDE